MAFTIRHSQALGLARGRTKGVFRSSRLPLREGLRVVLAPLPCELVGNGKERNPMYIVFVQREPKSQYEETWSQIGSA